VNDILPTAGNKSTEPPLTAVGAVELKLRLTAVGKTLSDVKTAGVNPDKLRLALVGLAVVPNVGAVDARLRATLVGLAVIPSVGADDARLRASGAPVVIVRGASIVGVSPEKLMLPASGVISLPLVKSATGS